MEPSWNLTSNHPGPPRSPCRTWWNSGGTLVEPWWNPRGTLPQRRPGPPQSLSGLRPQSFQLLGKKHNNGDKKTPSLSEPVASIEESSAQHDLLLQERVGKLGEPPMFSPHKQEPRGRNICQFSCQHYPALSITHCLSYKFGKLIFEPRLLTLARAIEEHT